MKSGKPSTSSAVSQLCPNCGLCCNGVLFADGELQLKDDPKKLSDLGMKFFFKGRKQSFFQPCACFDGKLCGIYKQRPVRCRTFECGLLKRVDTGKATIDGALASITSARQQIEAVRKLIREFGETDETLSLNRRYAAIAARPIDLAGGAEAMNRRSRLMLSMAKLARTLEREFLTASH